jgi:HEAT repeat protein
MSIQSPIRIKLHRECGWAQIGPVAAEAVPALITALSDADEGVRRGAARALGQIGPAASEAVPALTVVLHDPDKDVIENAKAALEQIQLLSPAANST